MTNTPISTNTRKVHAKIVFGISIVVFGIINVIWHHYSDYKLNYWIAENYYKINLGDYWSGYENKENSIWMLNSLYIERTFLTIVIFFTLFIASGVMTTQLIFAFVERKKVKVTLIIGVIILWIMKVPIPYYYSTLPSTEAGLFAW